MAKMVKYESIFVVNPQLEDEKIKEIIEKMKSLVESNAQLEKIEEWGKKKLAYEIAKQKEGYYVLMQFTAEPNFPAELERVYKITEGVIRYLIVKRDEKE
jgi:small subunit ribosomal protein S6